MEESFQKTRLVSGLIVFRDLVAGTRSEARVSALSRVENVFSSAISSAPSENAFVGGVCAAAAAPRVS